MDPISLVIGGALLATGWLSGRITRRRSAPSKPPKLVCACHHARSYHDAGTGRCHESIEVGTNYYDGEPRAYRQEQCPCQLYDGPAPELSPEQYLALIRDDDKRQLG